MSFLGSLFGSNTAKVNNTTTTSATNINNTSTQNQILGGDLYSQLYSGAASAAAGVDTSGIKSLADNLLSAGSGFLNTLQSPTDTAPQLDALKAQLDQFYNETVLPGITSQSESVGGYGGSRQGVAQGIAAQGLETSYAQGAASIINQDQQNKISAASAGLGALILLMLESVRLPRL